MFKAGSNIPLPCVSGDVLTSIVESEGVRVEIDRVPTHRAVRVVVAIPQSQVRLWSREFEIDDQEIEESETKEMVEYAVGRIRLNARAMRTDVAVGMFDRGVELQTDEHIERLACSIEKHADQGARERLAIRLMAHVERLGK